MIGELGQYSWINGCGRSMRDRRRALMGFDVTNADSFETQLSKAFRNAENGYARGPAHGGFVTSTWQRVARAVSRAETGEPTGWRARFRGVLEKFPLLRGGRIFARGRTQQSATSCNCCVIGAGTVDG